MINYVDEVRPLDIYTVPGLESGLIYIFFVCFSHDGVLSLLPVCVKQKSFVNG